MFGNAQSLGVDSIPDGSAFPLTLDHQPGIIFSSSCQRLIAAHKKRGRLAWIMRGGLADVA